MSHSRVIGILSKYALENGNGLFGIYGRMLAIRASQKRQRGENRGFRVVGIVVVQPFHRGTVLVVTCAVRAFVRTVKGCCGLQVIPFSWGLWVQCRRFLD